eukprot:TRINITY_DN388_c0_g1_i1.p1 TRINITY_DN388_c0_g1~~TRINITY_DN388_c0_g1_i1.p1  ORF type:complete len:242 (+),score=15.37 TRINITY_DN388_c0_g1_i1:108-833(+)
MEQLGLPTDCYASIFQHLAWDDILRLRMVSRKLRVLVRDSTIHLDLSCPIGRERQVINFACLFPRVRWLRFRCDGIACQVDDMLIEHLLDSCEDLESLAIQGFLVTESKLHELLEYHSQLRRVKIRFDGTLVQILDIGAVFSTVNQTELLTWPRGIRRVSGRNYWGSRYSPAVGDRGFITYIWLPAAEKPPAEQKSHVTHKLYLLRMIEKSTQALTDWFCVINAAACRVIGSDVICGTHVM